MISEAREAEDRYLAGYDAARFPAFAVSVDLAILTIRGGHLSLLLVQRSEHPYRGMWALPGGFVRPTESVQAAAERELAEEAGIIEFTGHLEQLATYGDVDRDPRMRVVSVAYVALVPDLPTPRAGGDAAEARWWHVGDLALASLDPGIRTLAFDHVRIVTDALDRVSAKLEYTTLATTFVPEPFTLADLRAVYETVWGHAPDLANFRRKVLQTSGFVVPVQRSATAATRAGGRPPQLYRAGNAKALHPPLLRTPPTPANGPDGPEFAGTVIPSTEMTRRGPAGSNAH